MRGRVFYGAVIALCSLIMTGAGFATYFVSNTDRQEAIRVEVSEEEEEHVTFEKLTLAPGEEVGYGISIHTDKTGTSDVVLTLKENTAQVGMLKKFAFVRLVADSKTVFDERLDIVLSEGEFLLEQCLSSEKALALELIYYLPIDVGNEAQGTESTLTLSVRASNH